MIHTIFSILQKILFLALHIVNPNTFPKPLSPKEELECFKKIKLGDKKSKDNYQAQFETSSSYNKKIQFSKSK